jgi:hypothetical protein
VLSLSHPPTRAAIKTAAQTTANRPCSMDLMMRYPP